MAVIERSALVPFSCSQMFGLVNDIEQYPRYMKGCKSARLVEQGEGYMVGELTLGAGALQQTFTTRNTLSVPDSIEMRLEKGNFRRFESNWHFKALSDSACKVSLHMEFEFMPGLVDAGLEKLFNASANELVDAVVEEANKRYGATK